MRWVVLCVLLSLGCSDSAFVPWTPGPTGGGTEGDLVVTEQDQLASACFVVENTMGSVLQVADWVEQPQHRELLLIQLQGDVGVSGDATPIDGSALQTIGAWESVRVNGSAPDNEKSITLHAEPVQTFTTDPANGLRAMMCTVREFVNVTVEAGASLRAKPWDGAIGGILAIRVRDTLRVDGVITADASGYRGGQLRPDDGTTPSTNFEDLDTSNAGMGGGKGEGLNGYSFDQSARGNLANAGGGGNVHNAGGGGGALGGAGGFGGKQFPGGAGPGGANDNENTRGMPGAAVTVTDRLLFGGGGGAGQQNDSVAGVGGAGGGILFIVTDRLEGSGSISANGAAGADSGNAATSGNPDGAGGGGSGGYILMSTRETTFTGTITAAGGDGGAVFDTFDNPKGPGGGGGGGIILLQGLDQLTPDVSAGQNGTYSSTATPAMPWGATAGTDGVVVRP